MDYTGFYEFPFPSSLSEDDKKIKSFFFSLSDDTQLSLLNGSHSYEEFHNRVAQQMKNG